MVKYSRHALIILFSSFLRANGLVTYSQQLSERTTSSSIRIASTGSLDLPDGNPENEKLKKYLEDISENIKFDEEQNKIFEEQLELKKRRRQQRMTKAKYTASLEMSNSERKIGLVLAQVDKGRKLIPMGNTEDQYLLNLDTLQYRAFPESVKNIQTLINSRADDNFFGVVVIAVDPKGQAFEQGIRPGDKLYSSSATMGDKMWRKRTLEGLRSAMSSRKVVNSQILLEFTSASAEAKADNRYQLEISKPIGIEIEENADGYVVVSGFNENASKLVRSGVRVGDRILAVASSLGGTLWPVSTVEGVISACTARLPGQKVTLQFERPEENLRLADANMKLESSVESSTTASSSMVETSSISDTEKQLLKRCQEVLKKYNRKNDFAGKFDIPGLVADKVTDAVASGSFSFDATTLAMVMNAYNSCDQMDKAIHVFEAATGLRADGSTDITRAVIKGKESGELISNSSSLGLFTLSAVLRAWAKKGNTVACKRILGIIEGRIGTVIEGKTSAAWSTVGSAFIPDIRCYNIILSALAEAGDIRETLELFDSMGIGIGPNKFVQKNLVTYNTVIGALSRAGMSEEAFEVFSVMKSDGIKADKYTYGCLVRACSRPQDMQELLYDMKENKVKPNVITYNTMIKILCERLQWHDAKSLIADMEVNGVKPDSMTYGFLMGGLLKAGKYSACLTLFESACSDSHTVQLTENVHLYTTAIAAAAALNNHEKGFDLLKRMISSGVQPNTKTLTALQCACLSSGKTDMAVDIYRKIENPDGRAMIAGVEAMCLEGHFDEVLTILRQQYKLKRSRGALSGKQLMSGFQFLLRESLSQGDLVTARSCIEEFLSMGFIPSNAMFDTIVKVLNLKPPRKKFSLPPTNISEEHFEFLLFVMDSLNGRKLACNGELYSALLFAGARTGGLNRKICALIAESRVDAQEVNRAKAILSSGVDENLSIEGVGWENLWKDYDTYRKQIPNLPTVRVNFGKSQVRKVLSAERQVTYSGGRTQKQPSAPKANSLVDAQLVR